MTWDDRHADSPYPAPDAWLASLAPLLAAATPGPVLDLACGLGQNALWASSLGGDVLGVDGSSAALERARAEAARRGLTARFEPWDVEARGLPPGPWGAVLLFRFLDRSLFGLMADSLTPGGWLAWKTHLDHPLRGDSARPRRPEFLLRPGELLSAAAGLTVLEYREEASSGGALARLVARRPPA